MTGGKEMRKTILPAAVTAALIGLILLFSAQPASAAGARDQDKVLFISSYSLSYPTVNKQITGIKAGLDDDIYLYYEFMDTKTISDDAYVARFYDYINYKYSHLNKVDAIIAGDDNALQMILRYRNGFFKDVPVVYESIDSRARAELANELGMTGILENNSIKANLDLAVELYPKARQIVAISDDSATGQALSAYTRAIRSSYPVPVKIMDTSTMTSEAIASKLSDLDTGSIVLYLTFTHDRSGKIYTYQEALDLIVSKVKAPVFTAFWTGCGTLGGYAPDFEESGKTAGIMASKIINGASVDKIASQTGSKPVATFDARVIKKYGIAKYKLPSDARIVHDNDNYTALIFLIVALLVSLTVLTIWLLKLRRDNLRRRKSETDLRRISDRLKVEAELDSLTRLGNRRLLDRDLKNSMGSARIFELFLIDLDDFKGINDRFGHQVGDQILIEIGKRLNSLKCRQFTPYRYGGDEFAVIYFYNDDTGSDAAFRTASQILELFMKPIVTSAGDITVTISIGSATYSDDSADAEMLFTCADKALYTVKSEHKNGYRQYDITT